MKLFKYVAIIAGLLIILFFILRYETRISQARDRKKLSDLRTIADSGLSLKLFLERASEFDYLLAKIEESVPEIVVPPDSDSSFLQLSSLTPSTIDQLSKIQKGKIQLRERTVGYFLLLTIDEGKISATKESYPVEIDFR